MDPLTRSYLSVRNRLRLRARRILGNDAEADDALQEAFYRLWARKYELRSDREAEALLSTAVRNVSLDMVRRKGRISEPVEVAERMAFPDTGPDERETLGIVRRIIDRELTETQRFIIERKEYAGESMEDIAAELGMQPAAVRMQLSRARKTIRACYRRTDHDE